MLIGEPPSHWRSLERVYEVYRRAHQRAIQMDTFAAGGAGPAQAGEACIRVYFRLRPGDIDQLSEGPPALVALHGSCVLDRSLVYRVVSSLRECDGVIVSCSSDVEIIKSFRHSPAPSIVNLSVGTEIGPRTTKPHELLRLALGLDESAQIVTCISRLIPHKNPHIFLQMVNILRKKHNVVGILCGDYWDDYPSGIGGAAYRDYMRRVFETFNLERQLLRLRGNMSDDELSLLLAGSDLLIHPSLTVDENYGFAPVEAIACGTPVVTTGYGGMKDNVVDGVTGYRARTWTTETGARADMNTLLQHADRLLSSSEELRKMAAHCEAARTTFSTGHAVALLTTAIRDLIVRYTSGCTRRCMAPPLAASPAPTRWTIAGWEATWPLIAPSVAQYVSLPEAVNSTQFVAIRRFGSQTFSQRCLTVSTPSVCFSGPVTPEEVGLLERIGDRWIAPEELEPAQLSVATNLLRAGVLTGTYSAA